MKDKRLLSIIRLTKRGFGQYKKQIILLTILGFVSGLLEGIGINALIPLFSFVLGEGGGGNDIISQLIEKFFGLVNIDFNITFLLVLIILLFILKAVMTVIIAYLKIKITADYEYKTRKDLFNKILNANWPHLIKQKLGHLETILMIDVKNSGNLLLQISTSIMTLTGLGIYLLIAINISFNITLITLIVGAFLFLVIKPLVYKTKLVAYQRTKLNKEIAHHVNENILGIKTIKTMVVNEDVVKKVDNHFAKLKELVIRTVMLETTSISFLQPASLIFISLIFAYSYKLTDFNLGILVAIIYLIHRIFVYIQQLQRNWHKFNNLYPHLVSVLNYQDKAIGNKEKNTGTKKFQFKKNLVLKNINFSYDSDKQILSDINFSISKGQLVGIIGPSGVGKTTMVDLLLRLLDPTSGQILLDNNDITEINLDDWRRNIGYVSQDIFLMNDTIANNIKFYDDSIGNEKLIEVTKMANIYDLIEDLPDKFETVIGERGVKLSAGQRQRIVIARVLARDPQILILDEATSALDNESEIKIQEVIESLKGRVTVLAIAHRLTTVKDSDKLLVLEDGHISEQGAPQELLKNKESYFSKTYNLRM